MNDAPDPQQAQLRKCNAVLRDPGRCDAGSEVVSTDREITSSAEARPASERGALMRMVGGRHATGSGRVVYQTFQGGDPRSRCVNIMGTFLISSTIFVLFEKNMVAAYFGVILSREDFSWKLLQYMILIARQSADSGGTFLENGTDRFIRRMQMEIIKERNIRGLICRWNATGNWWSLYLLGSIRKGIFCFFNYFQLMFIWVSFEFDLIFN